MLIISILITFLLAFSSLNSEEWESLPQVNASNINNSYVIENQGEEEIYLRNPNYLFKLDDKNELNPISYLNGMEITFNNNCVFKFDYYGLFRSLDNGVTWEKIMSGVYIDAVGFQDKIYLFYCKNPAGSLKLLESDDNGNTWNEIKTLKSNFKPFPKGYLTNVKHKNSILFLEPYGDKYILKDGEKHDLNNNTPYIANYHISDEKLYLFDMFGEVKVYELDNLEEGKLLSDDEEVSYYYRAASENYLYVAAKYSSSESEILQYDLKNEEFSKTFSKLEMQNLITLSGNNGIITNKYNNFIRIADNELNTIDIISDIRAFGVAYNIFHNKLEGEYSKLFKFNESIIVNDPSLGLIVLDKDGNQSQLEIPFDELGLQEFKNITSFKLKDKLIFFQNESFYYTTDLENWEARNLNTLHPDLSKSRIVDEYNSSSNNNYLLAGKGTDYYLIDKDLNTTKFNVPNNYSLLSFCVVDNYVFITSNFRLVKYDLNKNTHSNIEYKGGYRIKDSEIQFIDKNQYPYFVSGFDFDDNTKSKCFARIVDGKVEVISKLDTNGIGETSFSKDIYGFFKNDKWVISCNNGTFISEDDGKTFRQMKFKYGGEDNFELPVRLISFADLGDKILAVSDGLGVFTLNVENGSASSVEVESKIFHQIIDGKIIFENNIDELTVFDVSGRQIKSQGNTKEIYLSELPKDFLIIALRIGVEYKILKIDNR